MSSLRVLVTGSTGMLGSHLVLALSQYFEVLTQGFKHQAKFNADFRNEKSCNSLLETIQPDAVVNLIALTNVDECEKSYQKTFDLNICAASNIARWCKEKKRLLIHISTDQVYNNPGPSKEDDVVIVNNYALSKRAGEIPVEFADGIVLRTNFFGKSLLPNRPSFSDWLLSMFKKQQPFPIFNDIYFSPLHFSTLCSAIRETLINPQPGIYNLGSHDGLSKAEFVLKIAEKLNLPIALAQIVSVQTSSLIASRPLDMRMNVSKFETVFKFQLPLLTQEIDKVVHDEWL